MTFLENLPIYSSEEKRDGKYAVYLDLYKVTDIFLCLQNPDQIKLLAPDFNITSFIRQSDPLVWDKLVEWNEKDVVTQYQFWTVEGNDFGEQFGIIGDYFSKKNIGCFHAILKSGAVQFYDKNGQPSSPFSFLYAITMPCGTNEPPTMVTMSGSAQIASHIVIPRNVAVAEQMRQLVEEIIKIGADIKDPSYASSGYFYQNQEGQHTRDPRTREIGSRVNDIGGFSLMQSVHKRVSDKLGSRPARELEMTWSGIGQWLS